MGPASYLLVSPVLVSAISFSPAGLPSNAVVRLPSFLALVHLDYGYEFGASSNIHGIFRAAAVRKRGRKTPSAMVYRFLIC